MYRNKRNRNGNELGNDFQIRKVIDLGSDRWFQEPVRNDGRCSDNPWVFENGYGLDEDGNYPEVF